MKTPTKKTKLSKKIKYFAVGGNMYNQASEDYLGNNNYYQSLQQGKSVTGALGKIPIIGAFKGIGEGASSMIAPEDEYGVKKGSDFEVGLASIFDPISSTANAMTEFKEGNVGKGLASLFTPWGGGIMANQRAKENAEVLKRNARDESVRQTRLNTLSNTNPMQFKSGGTIYIKPENRGKFTATKKATGKSTEELTHSNNPLTRKRAIFAQNARKWHHPDGGYLTNNVDSAYVNTVQNYRPQSVKTQEYGDFDKSDYGDLLSSRPLYDPNNKKSVIATENYYKGVPGPIYLNQSATEGARMEKYKVGNKTRFAGSESPTFKCGGKMANGGMLKSTMYKDNMTYYQSGGQTHENSPYGGIPIGNKGLVEDGEVRWKDYVFSNRF